MYSFKNALDIPPQLPCCGVASLCYLTNTHFVDMFLEIKETFKFVDDWYGGMTLPEVLLMLIYKEYDFEEIETGKTLEEFAFENSGNYIVNVPGHFVYVSGNLIHDQYGIFSAGGSAYSHKKIKKSVKIF
jgi:hypothetical protein